MGKRVKVVVTSMLRPQLGVSSDEFAERFGYDTVVLHYSGCRFGRAHGWLSQTIS